MSLRDWYLGLSERDRRTVAWGAPIAGVLLVITLLFGLASAVHKAEARVGHKAADLAWLQAVAPRVQALPAGGNPGEPLSVLVDRTAREAGLGQAITGAVPHEDGGLEVHFEGAQFDAVVAWLTRLQQELGVTIQAAALNRGETAGSVNASLTLRRG